MIAAIQDFFYCASDMDRSVAFYRPLLGCEPRFASAYWTEFEVGGVAFGIHWSEGRPIARSDPGGAWAGATVSFRVEDIDRAAGALANGACPSRVKSTDNPGETAHRPRSGRKSCQPGDGSYDRIALGQTTVNILAHRERAPKDPIPHYGRRADQGV
jgi:hypothetical protein